MISAFFAWLSPYKWIAEILGVFALIGGGIYAIHHFLEVEQQIGYDRAKTEYSLKLADLQGQYTQAQLLAEQKARAKEHDLAKQLEGAKNDSVIRDQKIKKLSSELNTTTSSLRNTITTLRGELRTDSISALRNRADTAYQLLDECQAEYGKVAESADRHASDVTLLQQAWPK